MELDDLVLKHYKVQQIGRDLLITEDENGRYKADRAETVRKALTKQHVPENVFVRTSLKAKWYKMSSGRR